MANEEIGIMGVLNSLTTDQTIAKAEQIELTLPDKTKTKIDKELLNYIKGCTSEQIMSFMELTTKEDIKTDSMFLCKSSTASEYIPGHIYFYDSKSKILSDITPAGSGSSGTGTTDLSLVVNFRQTTMPSNTTFNVPYTWTSINGGYGYVYWLIDGSLVTKNRMQPGTSSFSVPGLSRGTHQLLMYVVDSGGKTSTKWTLSVIVGSLEITSNFNDSKIYSLGTDISIPYSYYTVDENSTYSLITNIDSVESESELKSSLALSGLTARNHEIKMKVKAVSSENVTTFSNELSYSILVAQTGVLYVSSVGDSNITIKQNDKLTLTTKVTYIGAKSFTASLKAYKQINGNYVEETKHYASDAEWYNGNNSYIITNLDTIGIYKFVITVKYSDAISEEIQYNVDVQQSELLFINQIVDESMLLHLSAKGKSNNDLDKQTWKDSSVDEIKNAGFTTSRLPVDVSLHDFNYTTNGWMADENGQSRLVLNSGSYVEINLKPLLKEIGASGENGFTFDIEYATKDILDSEARVVSCFNGQRGFWINTEYATLSNSNSKTETIVTEKEVQTDIQTGTDIDGNPLYLTYTQYTQTGPFQTVFQSETKTRITFVVTRGEKTNGIKDFGDYQFASMNIYVNGVLTSTEKITDMDDLVGSAFENGGMKIYLGCDNDLKHKGYSEIYNLRAYKRALTMDEVLVNYISDIEDAQEQSNMIKRNGLKGTISTDLSTADFYFTPSDFENMTKDNKVIGRCIFTNYDGSVESFDKYIRCQWQGTSSLAYVVKNYKIKIYSDYGLKTKYKIDIGNGIVENTFTLKADYMDSAHMRNTGTANFVSDLGTELCPAQEFIPACRTSIYGFPILLYVTLTDNKDPITNELQPTADDLKNRTLMGVYNLNLDKGCTDSLGLYTKSKFKKELSEEDAAVFDEQYPNWDCMSFEGSANSDTTAGAFASLDDNSIFSDFELRFEDVDDLTDKTSIGMVAETSTSVTIENINSDINGVYTKNISNNTLVGTRYILTKTSNDLATTLDGDYVTNYEYRPDLKLTLNISEGICTANETSDLRIARRYNHLKKLIKWVKDSDIETFKKDFEKHFNLSACIDYYLTVFVLLMVDNLGKNVMWNTWGPASKAKYIADTKTYTYTANELKDYDNYIWYPQFYDMDTELGLDNSGNMRFDVYEEVEPGIFNTSSSLMWSKFKVAFADELKKRYIEQRVYSTEHSSYTEKSLLEYYFERQVLKVSEANYNFDIKQKYLKHEDYLFMSHGRQYEYFLRWMSQRLYFLDTVYEIGSEWGKQSTVRVEYGDFATTPVTFKIQTYKPSYVQINFTAAAGKSKKLKVPRNGIIDFSEYVTTATDQEVIIYDAPNIKSLGDISPYTPKLVELSQMTKLTELTVGTKDHPNPNLTSLSLGSNTYLTKLIAENCTAMSGSINVKECTNLQYISTKGSTISYVQFNENGGGLLDADFSYATTTINMHNFILLRTLTLESLDNLVTLDITNCPLITGTNENGVITNGYIYGNILTNWIPENRNTSISLDGYGNIASYKFLDACSSLHEAYGLESRRINLGGQITYLGTAIPNRYSTYKDYFSDLTVKYPNVNDVSSMFENYKNINAIYPKQISIVDELTGAISYVTKYYWTDPKEDKFGQYLEDGCRPLSHYDDEDQLLVADEIKERLDPFEKFENMTSMFKGDEFIEVIHPDTFDKIDVSGAANGEMLSGCKRLKYFECPKFKTLDGYVFAECEDTTIYIPKEVTKFSNFAFSCSTFMNGRHQLVLFEKQRSDLPSNIPYVRDARFGIVRNIETGRPLNSEVITCDNIVSVDGVNTNVRTDLIFDNFTNGNGLLVYNVRKEDGSKINFETWNETLNMDGTIDVYTNPLDLYEMLYKSMKNFDFTKLKQISIPSFDLTTLSDDASQELSKEETSFSKLFYESQDEMPAAKFGSTYLTSLYLLMDKHTEITPFMFEDSGITTIGVQQYLTKIGNCAFKDSKLENLILYLPSQSILKKIGEYAFSNTHIKNIYIPDSVIDIGEGAYEKNNYITELKYSSNMTYVPIKCFKDCNKASTVTSAISGFSSKITSFGNYAFDGSLGLQLVSAYHNADDSIDDYKCYWVGTNSADCKFLDYFTNLNEIGTYAFRNILNIKTIKLNPKIQYIGTQAFVPASAEYQKPTKLIWEPETEANKYSNMIIDLNAFSGREFDWESNINGFNQIIKQTVFIPSSVYSVKSDAFSATCASVAATSVLRFVLTDAVEKPEHWDETFATGQLKTVYNYYTSTIQEENGATSLYFLLKDKTAIYARLMNNPSSILFPETVSDADGYSYVLKELAEEALLGKENNLNSLYFANNSKITKIGENLLTYQSDGLSKISNISVIDSELVIPQTISEIGKGIPFKKTLWYRNLRSDDFVYLNSYCLGYSESDVALKDTAKIIKEGTKVIYDKAFEGEGILSISLPTTLTQINDNAFKNCSYMDIVDLTPCAETLFYIGNSAFDGTAITSLEYTKALRHVGTNATANCRYITKYVFDQGCDLDDSSKPITPILNDDQINVTITSMHICASMGKFFSPTGRGFTDFNTLSKVQELVLGSIKERKNLSILPDDEQTIEGSTLYGLDLYDCFGDSATYVENGETKHIVLKIKKSYFDVPNEDYASDISIGKMDANLYADDDLVRIVMGFKSDETHTIYAKSDFINRTTKATYRTLFGNRVTVAALGN